jgi:hypothetical protein
MSAGTQQTQHLSGLMFINWLTENLPTDVNSGVGCENGVIAVAQVNSLGFLSRQTFHIRHRIFSSVWSLVDVGRINLRLKSNARE